MISFVKRCVWKFLNQQEASCMDIDLWNFNSQKDVWNEFMDHYMKLIFDEEAKFNLEYSYHIEVSLVVLLNINFFKLFLHKIPMSIFNYKSR